MANRESQVVTSDKTAIPSHFIPLSSYGCCAKDRPASVQYTILHTAWQRGELGGVKFMATPSDFRGQIFIDPAKAEVILRKDVSKPPKPKPAPILTVAGEQLEPFLVVFVRIAEALEAIATQPKESNHTPYGDLLHTSTNGDR
jgi:hypothetical protein